MAEMIQEVLTKVALAGALAAFLACLTVRFGPCAVRFVDAAFRRYIALPFLGKVLLPVFFGIAFVYGSTKTNGVCRSGLMMLMPRNDVAQVWQSVGANVVRAEVLYRCGATEDALCLPFDEGFVFPDGTNHLDRVVILSSGEVRRSLQDRDALVRFGERLWSRPYVSELTAEHTPSNSYRMVWRDFYANGDTNLLRTASAELFRKGDLAIMESGGTTLVSREIPFPHDGFGQDDDWVRANFTNAAEVLAVGYADWVDGQVGVGLENGLYKFTATFPDVPPEATRLWVGDKEVCVTNAGEYVFLLEKGVEYEFGTEPYDDTVIYRAEDDLPHRRLLGSAEDEWDHLEWTVDQRPIWIELPSNNRIGHMCWLPYFTVTPDVCHYGSGDPPQTFCAYFGDYLYGQKARYLWTCEDANVVFTAADSNETAILLQEMPDWRETRIVAHAFFGTNEFNSVARFHYGHQPEPSVEISFAKKVAFFENNYTNSYGDLVVGRADFATLNCEVHGGEKGGRVRIELNAHERIRPLGDVQFPYEDEVDVGEVKFYSFVCMPQSASETLNDITASVLLTENETGDNFDDVSLMTAVEVKSYVPCNWIPRTNRRELGVGEEAVVYTLPGEYELPLTVDGCVYTNEQWVFFAGERAGMRRVVLNCLDAQFGIDFETVEPQCVSVLGCYASSTVESGVVGGLQCDFDLRLYPTNVSFSGVEISEIARVATNAVGFFARPELSYLLDHGKHGGGNWHGLLSRNSFNDMARIGAIAIDIGEGGSFTYPIPRAWRMAQTSVTNMLPHRAMYDQRFELDANGTIRIKKFGYISQRTRNGVVTSRKESE